MRPLFARRSAESAAQERALGGGHDHGAGRRAVRFVCAAGAAGANDAVQLFARGNVGVRGANVVREWSAAFFAFSVTWSKFLILLEATPGIEPGYTVLQTVA
jgi:hypothetical protein